MDFIYVLAFFGHLQEVELIIFWRNSLENARWKMSHRRNTNVKWRIPLPDFIHFFILIKFQVSIESEVPFTVEWSFMMTKYLPLITRLLVLKLCFLIYSFMYFIMNVNTNVLNLYFLCYRWIIVELKNK